MSNQPEDEVDYGDEDLNTNPPVDDGTSPTPQKPVSETMVQTRLNK